MGRLASEQLAADDLDSTWSSRLGFDFPLDLSSVLLDVVSVGPDSESVVEQNSAVGLVVGSVVGFVPLKNVSSKVQLDA